MAKTYSFRDTKAAITGPGGSFSITNGSAEEGITIAMREDKNNLLIGADGSGMHSLRADKSGTITVRLLKNSPTNAILSGMYNFQTASSTTHGQNVITITSTIGDVITATGVAFKKQPDITYSKDGNINEWSFEAIEVTEILAASLV